jgi:hypothetical protein
LEFAFQNIGCESIQEYDKKTSFYTYPNPTSDFLKVSSIDKTLNLENSKFQIFDLIGKEIPCVAIFENDLKIDVRSWNAGIYFLRIENKGIVSTQKFIVSH